MKKTMKTLLLTLTTIALFTLPVFADGGDEVVVAAKANAAAIAICVAAAAAAIGMGIAIAKSVEGISRQPEANGKIQTSLMLGLVFIETVVIYALIVAILIVFVL